MRSRFRRAQTLTEADLRALWRLRLSLIALKPTVSEDQDFLAFQKDFDWPGWVWSLHDGESVVGFFLQRGVKVTYDGQELLALLPEYGFLAPSHRGRPVVPLASVVITALVMLIAPRSPKVVAASTYPPGYVAFRQVIRPFWTLGAPGLPAWERGLLLQLAEQVSGASFEPKDGTVTMRTLPFPPKEAQSDETRRLYADYVAENPRWREGRGLFFMFPVSAWVLARVVLHAGRRWLKTLRRR